MDEQKTLNEEYGLGPEWTPVDSAPITPESRPSMVDAHRITDSYLAGSISPSLQHDAYFVQSGYVTPSVASSPLMPIAPAGIPSNNAGVQQTIKTITVTSSTPPGGSSTAVQFNNGGAFGGDTGFTYDSVTNSIFVAGDFTLGGSFVIGGGIVITGNVNVTGYINSTTGFRQGGTAASGHYLRGNGTNFVSAVLSGSDVLTGLVGVTYGGTGADLSGTGGTSQVLRQSSTGASITVSQLNFTDLAGSIAFSQLPAGLLGRLAQPGIPGMDGLDGEPGPSGPPGLAGATGPAGTLGPSGFTPINAIAQTTSQGTTTLYAVGVSQAGVYRVTADLITTTAGAAGTVLVTIGWSNGSATQTNVSATLPLTGLGNEVSLITVLYSVASQNITYAWTVVGLVGADFSVRIRLEYLG